MVTQRIGRELKLLTLYIRHTQKSYNKNQSEKIKAKNHNISQIQVYYIVKRISDTFKLV